MFFNKKKLEDNYKLRTIKVFNSIENLSFNRKSYRKVFDVQECGYIYCELAFYNKLFDVRNWKTEVKFICQNIDTEVRVCKLSKKINIKKDQNVVFVREGWGTPDPGWWKKGRYSWRVFVGDVKIGETVFYITDVGLVTKTENPYFSIDNVKLFEGPKEVVLPNERIYLNTFDEKNTRFVNIEMSLANHLMYKKLFPLELQFNFYNEIGQHKAFAEYFKEIKEIQKIITLDVGYGSNTNDYWYKGQHRIEILFMNQLIKVVPFEIGDEAVEADKTEKEQYSKTSHLTFPKR